jgi:hypothetical protein
MGDPKFTNQIKVFPYTLAKSALTPINSRQSYECANSEITRGLAQAPASLQNCFNSFPAIQNIATQLGVNSTTIWRGPTADVPPIGTLVIRDLLTGITGGECDEIKSSLGQDWLGCLWGTPETSFSCVCPEVGANFEAYLKHRLNVATFWKTPIKVPVDRREFLDGLKYLSKVDITVAGDFNLRPGYIIELLVDHPTRSPINTGASIFSGLYLIVSVKHVLNSGGTHETALTVTQIPDK